MSWNPVKRCEALKSKQQQFEELWEQVGRFAFPRMPNARRGSDLELDILASKDTYDGTFRRAIIDHANGFHGMVFPLGQEWLGFKGGRASKDNQEADKYFEECREEVSYRILQSNFLDIIHRVILERVAFGTGGIYSEWYDDGPNFRDAKVGTYVIGQDQRGVVNEVYIKLEYTAEDAASEWGKDKLPQKVKEKLGANQEEKFCFTVGFKKLHEWEDDLLGKAKGKPVLMSVVLDEGEQEVETDGFHEMPFAFSRYLTTTGNPYGFTPSFLLLPEARRLERQQELADQIGLATLSGGPMAALAKYKGRINRGPNGVTYIEDMGEVPQLMRTSTGEYKIGLDRIAQARDDIKDALNIDFFKMFSNLDNPDITATVGRYLQAEKSMNLGSPYLRFMTEMVAPVMERTFKMCYRNGVLPEPPESLIVGTDAITGQPDIPMPEVVFENRIIEAMEAGVNLAYMEWFSTIGAVMQQVAPDEVANFDMNHIALSSFRNLVKDEDAIRPPHEAKKIKEEIQASREQAQQMAMAQQGAGAAKDAKQAGLL